MSSALQIPLIKTLKKDELIKEAFGLVFNEFKRKDLWYNLFENEATVNFLTIDTSLKPIVFNFFYDNDPNVQA